VSFGKVVLAVGNLAGGGGSTSGGMRDVNEGDKVNLSQLTLEPGEGVVVILLMDVDFHV